MAYISIKYDCRAPQGVSPHTLAEIYDTALEQVAWIDRLGFPVTINFCEHHGSTDDYLPSPLLMAAAAARITRHVRLQVNVIAPFHDPLRIAEDMAVLDQLSNGRAEILLLGGYVPDEMAMFGVDPKNRGHLMDEFVATLKLAWRGDPFTYRGRPCRIRPQPLQHPHPPLFMGGTSAPAARRAGRMGDAFIGGLPELNDLYVAACREAGKSPRFQGRMPFSYLFASNTPEETWRRLAPYCLYETNTYARWQASASLDAMFQEATDADALRATGIYQVATPEQVLAVAPTLADNDALVLHPLMSGMDKDLSWEGLRVFFEDIAPHVKLNLI